MVVRLSFYKSQSPWWHSDCPSTHHSFPVGTQTIPTHITVYLMVLRVSLYPSQSPWSNSDYPYTHHSLQRGTQTIPLLTTVCLVALRLSLYSSQSTWWLRIITVLKQIALISTFLSVIKQGDTQSIPILITVSLMELRLYLYSSQTPSCYSDYLYTHHSLPSFT